MTGDGISGWPIASFFKIILTPRLDLLQLGIPSKFMATHGNDISNVVYLNTPPGKVWKFELVTKNGKTLLQKGWPEFVKFYSLKHGHLLVFKYEGNSHFDMVICDKSATEIEYPLDLQACMENPSKKRKISLTNPTSSKKDKFKDDDMEMIMDDKLVIGNLRGSSHFTRNEEKRVRSYAYQCEHPSFAVKMQPSFVRSVSSCYAGIPKEFAKKYLDGYKEQSYERMFRFQTDDNDKTWEVNIVGEKTHVRAKNGWVAFASENRLKVGDICMFELISKQDIKVHKLRVANAQLKLQNLAIKS
ncbi:hypothetical protein RDABS01_004450 [Bienertia sinuspersici]